MESADLTNINTKPLVLSYNICFQAMENSAQGSAAILGGKCQKIAPVYQNEKFTQCAANMAQAIDSFPASVNRTGYDFVGLQEANRARSLAVAAQNTLHQMESFHSENTFVENGRSQTVYMASFYDPAKYKKIYEYGGHFTNQPARLFQILVFNNNFDTSGTIFINVHSPHGFTFAHIETDLSAAIATLNLTNDEKQYRKIAVGDFNETGWDWATMQMNQTVWTPFSGISDTLKIGNFVQTCSKDDGNWADANGKLDLSGTRGGDYIFDSKLPAIIATPSNYDPTTLKSDHLPVMAELS